jgi:hypothetical protein
MKKTITAVSVTLFIAACSQQPAPVYQQGQPGNAPVVVNQAPSNDGPGFLTGMLAGGLLGHMIGRNSGPSYAPGYGSAVAPAPTVINRTTVIKNYAAPATVTAPVKPSYAAAYSAARPAAPSRPSYGSFSSGRSSFSSSRRR